MPLPGDPATGLTGALTAMQQQPPMTAAPNLQASPGDGRGAGDLSRAARSLESVQGNVAGQTQAISQMAMASQQQMGQIQMTMSQLDMRISGLNQALQQLSTGMQMSAMNAPRQSMSIMSMPAPQDFAPPPPPMMPAGTNLGVSTASFARNMGQASLGAGMGIGGSALSGARGFGGALGGAGGSMVSPFMGAQISGPGPGQFGPSLGNAGFLRSAALGSGISIDPRTMRQAGAQQIAELGQERVGQRATDMGIAAVGGMGQLAAMGIGEGAAMGASSLMGAGAIGSLGLSIGLGLPVAALGGMAVDETMSQIANQRKLGEQFGRNAFRSMPQGQMGFQALRKPGLAQRQQVGEGVNKMAIDDLTFNAQDMSEIMASMSENDLMRGLRNTQQVVQRIRQGKETIKMMSRNIGSSISEAGGILGEMQGLGIDVMGQPQKTRQAIFGATSVPGMTREESLRRGIQLASPFVRQGLGKQALDVAGLGMTGVQTGIQSGSITPQSVAAFGGREGMQQFVTQAIMGMTQTRLGKATMMAGMKNGEFDASRLEGLSFDQVMNAGSNNATTQNILEVTQRPTEIMQKLMRSPGAATELMVRQALSIGEKLVPGMDTDMKLRVGLQEHFKGMGKQLSGAEMTGYIEYLKSTPAALRAQQKEQARSISTQISNEAQENAAIIPRAGRELQRVFEGPASGINRALTSVGQDIGDVTESARRSILGLETTSLRGEIGVETLARIQGAGTGGGGADLVAPSESSIKAAEAVAMGGGVGASIGLKRARGLRLRRDNVLAQKEMIKQRGGKSQQGADKVAQQLTNASMTEKQELLREKVQKMRDMEDPDRRREAMKDILNTASGGVYGALDVMNVPREAMIAEGIQRAVMGQFGINPSAELTSGAKGKGDKALTEDEIEAGENALDNAQDMIDTFMTMSDKEVRAMSKNREIEQFLTAFSTGDIEGQKKARKMAANMKNDGQLSSLALGLQKEEEGDGAGNGRKLARDIASNMRKFADMDRIRSGETVITGMTGGIAEMLKEEMIAGNMGAEGIGQNNLRGLTSDTGPQAMRALGGLKLNPRQLRALAARSPGGVRAASALGIKGGNIDNISNKEMIRMAKLVGVERFNEMLDGKRIDENELGLIRSRALAEGGMTVDILTGKGGFSGQDGISLLENMASSNKRTAEALESILSAFQRIEPTLPK